MARAITTAALLALPLGPSGLSAQTTDHIALGDVDHAALNASSALRHYEDAIRADPKSYEALWKATRDAVDLGEFAPDEKERDRLFTVAEQYARRAVEVNPADATGQFQLSRALGRRALSISDRNRVVRYATEVHSAAVEALRLDPKHAGALHVLGMWHYNVKRQNRFMLLFAKAFFGGKVFNLANWGDAQRMMEEAVAIEPARIVHHLDLGRVYAARNEARKAAEQYQLAIQLPAKELNDQHYQDEARKELERNK